MAQLVFTAAFLATTEGMIIGFAVNMIASSIISCISILYKYKKIKVKKQNSY